ncbi:peptidase M1 [Prauserella marina]|uniref:Aminopeptidase N n=1 Tax=Prauserella marina TaxID=530584 RepID=A0A222VT31_9PSEU|nr:M1 family metallopeptidase [Prauserella marina]ASR37068.1 peptidase M1 [Prauserella marina]PWV79948.1 peptidase M1-like protein [Prauserella marina]SDD86418.1 Peptidase family M1 [Prauserella marina]
MTDSPSPGADTSGDSYLPSHGNGGYRVRHYDLDLDYRLVANRLAGTVTITAVATATLSRFSLDLSGFKIGRVLVDQRQARYSQRPGKLTVRPARAIPSGAEFTVTVRYSGNPRPVGTAYWGEVGWDELADGAIVASQPVGAPSWFPCDDRPSAKASYRLALTTSSAYSVLATGDLVSVRRAASTTTWVYERREPTASYLMGVYIGRYAELRFGDRVRVAVPARLREKAGADFARQAEMLSLLSRYFGPYPFAEYVVVVTDDELDDPIEAQGMAVFGANHVDGTGGAERLAVHELAHQWFGNSLTVADWRHIWLNEGFATYAEWLWSAETGGPSAEALARRWHRVLSGRAAEPSIGDPGVANMFDERVYKGGALTLHALRGELGDATFFALLRDWADTYRHGTVTTEAFVALAETHAGRALDRFFAAWLTGPALPPLP